MRTLTSPTITAATSDSSQPYCLLRIDFPSPIGTKWYAQEDFGAGDATHWNDAQGRVLEWGAVRLELRGEQHVNVVGDCTIKLRDEDKALWGYFQTAEPQRSRVTIYQQFRGNAAADLVVLHTGIVNAPCRWSERDHAITLDVTDLSTYFDRTVGNYADRLDYPNVVQTDENKVIPLVFGHVKRSRAVALDFGPVTSLARQVGYYDNVLYVNDAEKFPQDTPCEIWIQAERITGKFHGNTFYVTARGAAVYTGTVTALGVDAQHVVDSALTGVDGQWTGDSLQVTTPDGRMQQKFIRGYDASTHTLIYGLLSCWKYTDPFTLDVTWSGDLIENAGAVYTLPIGTTYQIVCPQQVHASGTKVYLARDKYVYVCNDAPSKAVYYVEGWGHPIVGSSEEWYVTLQSCAFTINLDDRATCPGRAVTSISFFVPPSQLDTRLRDDNLFVTLDGVESAGDGTGTLIENPSDVIQAIHKRWMGMTSSNIDAGSFASAKTSTAPLKMGFALEKQWNGLALCAELAFQARCAEVFFAGKAQLIFLTNVMTPGGSPATTGPDRYLGSLDIARREWNRIITEVTGVYVDNAIRETIILRSGAAEAFVGGRRAKTIDFWAYATLPPVQGVAQFWLNRWQYIWQQIALVDSLRRLDTTPYDVVDLDLAGWFGAGQIGRVMGIEQTLGGGAGRAVPGIKLTAEIPYFPSGTCDTLAEAMPPAGCWACENSCQLGCELFCTTQWMLNGITTLTTPATTAHTPPHTTAHGTTPYGSRANTSPFGTDGPTEPPTDLPSSEPTELQTTEWHTAEPTEWHTNEPTEWHTDEPTEPPPTSEHTEPPATSPHTWPPGWTTPEATLPAEPPTSPFGCAACSEGTPTEIFVETSNGHSGTLSQVTEGGNANCVFVGLLDNGAFCRVQFVRWYVLCQVGTNNGVFFPVSSDGTYDCMASYAITVSTPPTHITVTIYPS